MREILVGVCGGFVQKFDGSLGQLAKSLDKVMFDYHLSAGFVFNAKMAARIKADEGSVDGSSVG